ncbi:hypothetical protein [Pseudonocardia sp. Ae706_Ps2]|uniref:hypothetical protein n=2 Tax=unclassified Pseudonocardia TaxID=2619320 RepID=UPI0011151CAA|nr:hypothetical protein [Pseudonocardia sp. Ae706_Ps2]
MSLRSRGLRVMFRSGVVLAVVLACLLSVVGVSAAASSPPEAGVMAARPKPPVSYQAYVRKVFTNSVGDPVFYRRGYWYAETPNEGFGFDKVFWKHNIKNDQVVAAVVNAPMQVINKGMNRWNHRGEFLRRVCKLTGCTVAERVRVLVAIDYNPFERAPKSGMLGVVTAFCELGKSRPRCPEWINHVFGGPARSVPVNPGEEREQVVYMGPDGERIMYEGPVGADSGEEWEEVVYNGLWRPGD